MERLLRTGSSHPDLPGKRIWKVYKKMIRKDKDGRPTEVYWHDPPDAKPFIRKYDKSGPPTGNRTEIDEGLRMPQELLNRRLRMPQELLNHVSHEGDSGVRRQFRVVSKECKDAVDQRGHQEYVFNEVELRYVEAEVPDKESPGKFLKETTWVLATSAAYDHPSHFHEVDFELCLRRIRHFTIFVPDPPYQAHPASYLSVEPLEHLISIILARDDSQVNKGKVVREKTIVINGFQWTVNPSDKANPGRARLLKSQFRKADAEADSVFTGHGTVPAG